MYKYNIYNTYTSVWIHKTHMSKSEVVTKNIIHVLRVEVHFVSIRRDIISTLIIYIL